MVNKQDHKNALLPVVAHSKKIWFGSHWTLVKRLLMLVNPFSATAYTATCKHAVTFFRSVSYNKWLKEII